MRSLVVVTVLCLTSTPAFACVLDSDCEPGTMCVDGTCIRAMLSGSGDNDVPVKRIPPKGKTCAYDGDCDQAPVALRARALRVSAYATNPKPSALLRLRLPPFRQPGFISNRAVRPQNLQTIALVLRPIVADPLGGSTMARTRFPTLLVLPATVWLAVSLGDEDCSITRPGGVKEPGVTNTKGECCSSFYSNSGNADDCVPPTPGRADGASFYTSVSKH